MHNLHLIVLRAENAQEAMENAEAYMEDYGSEDNWKTICGCVSQDNEVTAQEETGFMAGRYPPEENQTIESINKMVGGWITKNIWAKEAEAAMKKFAKGKPLTSDDWRGIRYHAEHMEEQVDAPLPFNILEDSFKSEQYDECGVTHVNEAYGGRTEEQDKYFKKYVVFVDMHS